MAVGAPPELDLPPVAGFRTANCAAGIKKNGKADLMLVAMAPETTCAGVFTRNQVVAAPVVMCRDRLADGRARALLVNAGNANVGYGPAAMLNTLESSKGVADALGVPDEHVFVSSTGVIGEPLPVARILAAVPRLAASLAPGGWEGTARAIMTTDTFPKGVARQVELGGRTVTLVGIAKGSGMIHPDMATMLAYVFTDAAISHRALQILLNQAVAGSFNRISVDGDTSTNDTLMAFASGAAANAPIAAPEGEAAERFGEALLAVCRELAQMIVRDGEGATKFITVTTVGARNRDEARQVCLAVAKSPLVKTACFASDPNFGRILAAVGYAGVPLEMERLAIRIGEATVIKAGYRNPRYTEEQGQAAMAGEEITIHINLGLGRGRHTLWTCDFSYDYVRINADYRT